MKKLILVPASLIILINLSAQINKNTVVAEMHQLSTKGNNEIKPFASRRLNNDFEPQLDILVGSVNKMSSNINGAYPEYTPLLTADNKTMFFTSRRNTNTGNLKTIDPVYKAEDIYFSQKGEDGQWSKAAKIPGSVNTKCNEAITWISPEGKKMLLCRDEDLFESELINGKWSKAEPLTLINSEYRETHASYSPDGNTIYFTTNNPEIALHGGLDICYVTKTGNGDWSAPKMVGNINSELDEEGPFLSNDGVLYFSSQGFNSIGGFDLFKSKMSDNGEFEYPENLGAPINSKGNEPFIFVSSGNELVWFSSDKGTDNRNQNIFEASFIKRIKKSLLIEVYDVTTGQLMNAEVNIRNQSISNDKIQVLSKTDGVFNVGQLIRESDYEISVTADDHKNKEIILTGDELANLQAEEDGFHYKVYLDPKDVVNPINLNEMVNFDYNKHNLTTTSLYKLAKLIQGIDKNKVATIIVKGHTDAIGTNDYNMELSEMRSDAVVSWFLARGFDPSIISIQYYGENKPMVDNNSAENRSINRRVEVSIQLK